MSRRCLPMRRRTSWTPWRRRSPVGRWQTRGKRRKRRNTRSIKATKKEPGPKQLVLQFPLRPTAHACDNMKQVRAVAYETGQRQAGDGVWVHRGDFPWFVRYACEEVAIGSGALWELDPAPDMRNTLEYVPAAGIWRCSWLGPASELMQTVDRRVPRTRKTGGVLRPMTAKEYLAAKEKARRLLLEEARGRGCDLNALSTLGLDLAAPPP